MFSAWFCSHCGSAYPTLLLTVLLCKTETLGKIRATWLATVVSGHLVKHSSGCICGVSLVAILN